MVDSAQALEVQGVDSVVVYLVNRVTSLVESTNVLYVIKYTMQENAHVVALQ